MKYLQVIIFKRNKSPCIWPIKALARLMGGAESIFVRFPDQEAKSA
jgi:hypothetical protein